MPVRESWRNVGRKIRYLRKKHQLTIRQLAAGCGLSPNAISLLERGEVAPTVATLCKIASALGAPASSFFQDVCPNEVILTRAKNHCTGQLTKREPSTEGELLADQALHTLTYATQSQTDLSIPDVTDLDHDQSFFAVYSHQFVLCLSGQIEYEANGQSYQLGPGDSLSFNGNVLHCWRNRSSDTAVAIMVFSTKATPDLALDDLELEGE